MEVINLSDPFEALREHNERNERMQKKYGIVPLDTMKNKIEEINQKYGEELYVELEENKVTGNYIYYLYATGKVTGQRVLTESKIIPEVISESYPIDSISKVIFKKEVKTTPEEFETFIVELDTKLNQIIEKLNKAYGISGSA